MALLTANRSFAGTTGHGIFGNHPNLMPVDSASADLLEDKSVDKMQTTPITSMSTDGMLLGTEARTMMEIHVSLLQCGSSVLHLFQVKRDDVQVIVYTFKVYHGVPAVIASEGGDGNIGSMQTFMHRDTFTPFVTSVGMNLYNLTNDYTRREAQNNHAQITTAQLRELQISLLDLCYRCLFRYALPLPILLANQSWYKTDPSQINEIDPPIIKNTMRHQITYIGNKGADTNLCLASMIHHIKTGSPQIGANMDTIVLPHQFLELLQLKNEEEINTSVSVAGKVPDTLIPVIEAQGNIIRGVYRRKIAANGKEMTIVIADDIFAPADHTHAHETIRYTGLTRPRVHAMLYYIPSVADLRERGLLPAGTDINALNVQVTEGDSIRTFKVENEPRAKILWNRQFMASHAFVGQSRATVTVTDHVGNTSTKEVPAGMLVLRAPFTQTERGRGQEYTNFNVHGCATWTMPSNLAGPIPLTCDYERGDGFQFGEDDGKNIDDAVGCHTIKLNPKDPDDQEIMRMCKAGKVFNIFKNRINTNDSSEVPSIDDVRITNLPYSKRFMQVADKMYNNSFELDFQGTPTLPADIELGRVQFFNGTSEIDYIPGNSELGSLDSLEGGRLLHSLGSEIFQPLASTKRIRLV